MPAAGNDPHDLSRFVQAQADVYPNALVKLRAGQKLSHWMWFVFPQFNGLGFSAMSRHYAIKSIAEAAAYLHHPVLGPRLHECCEAVLAVDGCSAHAIFGSPDDLKLRACATLFARVSPAGSVFQHVNDKYFDGRPDEHTTWLMDTAAPAAEVDQGRDRW